MSLTIADNCYYLVGTVDEPSHSLDDNWHNGLTLNCDPQQEKKATSSIPVHGSYVCSKFLSGEYLALVTVMSNTLCVANIRVQLYGLSSCPSHNGRQINNYCSILLSASCTDKLIQLAGYQVGPE